MSILKSRPDRMSQPTRPRPSRKARKRQRIFIASVIFSLAALAGISLAQFARVSFLRSATSSTPPLVPISGLIEDGQTGQPLANVPITARIFSFHTETTTDAQGHFSMRVPNSGQLDVSTPGYEDQLVMPGTALTVKLAPDPSTTAQHYMDAFMQQNFDQLWSMLHPDAQASWPSEAAFTTFLTRKFGLLSPLSYQIGQPNILSPWIDPDTTQVYNAAAVLPVSLTSGAASNVLSTPSAQAVKNGLFQHLAFAEVKSAGLWRVLVAGPLDQDAPIVAPANAPAISVRTPILMYHHVSARPTKNALDYGLTVKTADFAAQMEYLAKNGYHPVTLTSLFNNLYYGLPLPQHPIIISFDDGYEDTYTDAFPILQQHHFVAELNVITGMIGGSYLTWNQIRQMAAAGIEIGSHTIHHIDLAIAQPETARVELLDSKATLEQQISAPVQFFCYPSGEPFHHGTSGRQQFITTLLFQDGYIGALLDPGAESVIQDAQHPFELPRIRVGGGESLPLFTQKLRLQG